MNINSCEIRGLNIKSTKSHFIVIVVVLGVVVFALSSFYCLGGVSVCTFDHPSVQLRFVVASVCFAIVWLLIALQLIRFYLLGQETRDSYLRARNRWSAVVKLPLK